MKIDYDAFAAAWQAAATLGEAAAALGVRVSTASARACGLRAKGVPLKRFTRGPRYRLSPGGSRSDQAALAARNEGLTQAEAAARFGISRQAVSQAATRLFPDDPRQLAGRGDPMARGVIIELAGRGLPDDEIAEEVGYSASAVRAVRIAAGIKRISRDQAAAAAVAAAVEAVRGGARAIDAATSHGVSYGSVADRCRAAGIPLNGRPGIRTGALAVAVGLVERDGMSQADAARAAGCAPSGLSYALKRRAIAADDHHRDEQEDEQLLGARRQ